MAGDSSAGREVGAARRLGDARNKRTGRALPSAAETGTGVSLSGKRSGSSRRSGKRARHAVDDDVVVVEADDHAVTAAGSTTREVANKGPGARVAVKPERLMNMSGAASNLQV